MNQNKATSGTKLGGRDFINLGIFTVIFIAMSIFIQFAKLIIRYLLGSI